MYEFEVVRKWDSPSSAGKLYVFKDHEVIKIYDCITGPASPRPSHLYGGCTPELVWRFIEPISMWRGQECSRMEPVEGQDLEPYHRRTFDLIMNNGQERRDAFRTHIAGRTTGCICIFPHQWRSYVRMFNEAFQANGVDELIITVVEDT